MAMLMFGAAAAQTPDRSVWTGRWQLDKARSDSPNEMMKAVEVPWYIRVALAAFTPTLEVSLAEDQRTLDIKSTSFLGSRTETLRGDGVANPGIDDLGRPYDQSSRWSADGGSVHIHRALHLESGRTTKIQATWSIENNTLRSTIEIERANQPPLRVRRVFARTPE